MWNFEEYWHGEVLDEVLEVHGVPTGPEHTMALRKRMGWRDRLAPIKQSVIANVIGNDFIATHMTWGAINEWCTHSGYSPVRGRRVAPGPDRDPAPDRQAGDPAHRVLQPARPATGWPAPARPSGSPGSRWTRSGASSARASCPSARSSTCSSYLYGGPAGLAEARRIDAKIDALPGLDGLHLVERQLDKYGIAA